MWADSRSQPDTGNMGRREEGRPRGGDATACYRQTAGRDMASEKGQVMHADFTRRMVVSAQADCARKKVVDTQPISG